MKTSAKRKNFISIQQQQTIFTNGGQVPSVRSDFGTSVAQSVNSIFASAATDDGVVTAINEHAITVTYQDGTVAHYPLGIKHGSAAGVTYPHLLVTTLKVGGNLANSLNIIAEDITFDMQIKLKEYSQKLNGFILIYTFIAILGPVILLIMLMAASTVMGDIVPGSLILILYGFFFPLIVVFLGVLIQKLEPKI